MLRQQTYIHTTKEGKYLLTPVLPMAAGLTGSLVAQGSKNLSIPWIVKYVVVPWPKKNDDNNNNNETQYLIACSKHLHVLIH